ncbi:ABC transporter substrate-binding protein [Lysinibacillus sp. NPDC097162]|uniref:ABC transporter substrate-binding protein n=1 Tax=unclassified Lysinibacillus TaxID=2636778 RepID=UPI00380AEFC0
MLKKSLCLLLFSFILVTTGCSQSEGKSSEEVTNISNSGKYPMSFDVHTYEGKKVTQTINQAPEKVMIIGSSVAELMVKFGQQNKVVGFAYNDQAHSNFTEEIEKMHLVSEMWPSKESIIALQPDLIYSIASAFREELIGSIPSWSNRGIPVVSSTNFTIGRSIDIYFDEIKTFGKVFDIENQTNKYLKEQQARIDKITAKAKNIKDHPNVLLVSGARGKYFYYSPKWAIIDEMIEGAGAEYIELSKEDYIELSTEAIIAANPDKIIITEFQQPDQEKTKNNLINDKKLQNIKAIQNKDVMVAEYTGAINGGIELADLYEQVAKFIHPDVFVGVVNDGE